MTDHWKTSLCLHFRDINAVICIFLLFPRTTDLNLHALSEFIAESKDALHVHVCVSPDVHNIIIDLLYEFVIVRLPHWRKKPVLSLCHTLALFWRHWCLPSTSIRLVGAKQTSKQKLS